MAALSNDPPFCDDADAMAIDKHLSAIRELALGGN